MKFKIVQEFKEFALKGSVMDMAVGVIIGGALQRIITSLVNDILMPPVGLLLGGTDFSKLTVTLNPARVLEGAEPVLWRYGAFIQTCIDFTLLVFCVFMLVKGINYLRRKREKAQASAAPPAPSKEETLLAEIRDILAKGSARK